MTDRKFTITIFDLEGEQLRRFEVEADGLDHAADSIPDGYADGYDHEYGLDYNRRETLRTGGPLGSAQIQ